MSNLRLEITFKPSHLLTTVGSQISLLPKHSHLRILNSLQLVKVNTSNNQPLKIGQSFYLFFHFSEQYIYYDSLRRCLGLTKNLSERTLFKILTDQFDWNSRGKIQMGMLSKYRIILAEHNSKFLVNQSGQLAVSSKQNQNSLVSFEKSIYCLDSISYPIKLTSLENNLTLCYKNLRASSDKKPSICQYMISLQKRANADIWALRHIDSNSYLVKSGKQFVFMKDAPTQLKYCLRPVNYDTKGNYLYLSTMDNRYLKLNEENNKCVVSDEILSNILKKQVCTEESIKNILVSAWLKAELPMESNVNNIIHILDECQKSFQQFSDVYNEVVVQGLVTEGFFLDLQFISNKYTWQVVGSKIVSIFQLMIKIKTSLLADLFIAPNLYQKLMQEESIREAIRGIRINSEEVIDPHQVLENVRNNIFKQNQIDLTCLETILLVSPILKVLGKNEKHRELKQFVDHACEQIIPQLQKNNISSYYSIGLKIVKANTTPLLFYNQVMSYLSLNLLQSDRLNLEDKLILLDVFLGQTGPYVYITTESQTVRKIGHQKRNEHAVAFYIQDVLPKNCRFENYQNKMIAVSILPFHLRVNHMLEIGDCKEYIKYLAQSISTYSFDQRPQLFLRQCLLSLYELINRALALIAQKSLQYDSITQQTSQRVSKCKKQLDTFISYKILDLQLIWGLFQKDKKLSQIDGNIFILALQIYKLVVCPQSNFEELLKVTKVIDDPSPYLSKSISLFLEREHEFNPIQTSQKLTQLCKGMEGDQLLVIASLIHENNMYSKICYKIEAFYNVINSLALAKNSDESILDGQKILFVLLSRRTEWLYTDSEFIFLRNILNMIGGVISIQIYHCFENYICSAQSDQWSLSFFNLCSNIFAMSPLSLKKRLVINYQCQMKVRSQNNKLQSVLYNSNPQFFVAYIRLLLSFSNYHSSKEFIYQIIGDDLLFKLLQKFEKNNELKVKIINLMIKTRKRCNEYEDITFSPANLLWLKKGTIFIRRELQNDSSQVIKQLSSTILKDFTFAMIDFLNMREEIMNHTQISEDQILVIQGTNKLLAFQIIDMIEQTARNEQIERNLLDKIQWFESQYKINVNSMQLARVAIEDHKEQVKKDDFVYNYMLEVKKQLYPVVEIVLGKVNIQTFITILIKLILEFCFRPNPNLDNLELLLQYLHCVVSNKTYTYTQNDIKLLYLGMKQLAKNRKLKHVALMQNIVRKMIWINGQLNVRNQMLIQSLLMHSKAEFNDYLFQCIGNYMMFSPTYSSTLNYFNHNGQLPINWTVTCYISMLRFLIGLCKSLQLKFKQIFSQSQVLRKEFIGSLIELNQQHISQLTKQTSDTKLTLIVYEIQLINNLLRGPVDINIQTAIKFKYDNIISLIKIPDLNDDSTRVNTFKIIVQMKRLVAEAILILAPFQKYTDQQIKIIQQGLIVYYNTTVKLVGEKLDHVIEKYTKQNKHKIQVMNFDLALNLFYGLIRIYEKSGNLKIKRLRTDALRKAKLTKAYNKKFKMLYQIYRILSQSLGWIGRNIYNCCKKTATEIDQAMNLFQWQKKTHQEHLQQAFAFFVKNVSSVQIQVGSEIETIYFLLMKETKCYNASIRKQLHRKVGLGEREYRLTRFIAQSNHVILRLQIEKSIKKFTQKYKPIQIIIKNRQLWKSMNFLCACLLNFIFLAIQNIEDPDIPLYFLRVMSYIFCIFLYMIYFIQNLPLKRRLAQQMAKSSKPQKFKRIKSCLQIFNDKTLWFATIYFVIISLSIYHLGFVCLLMIDFFVRFKISKQVTQIVTRPIIQILLIILISVQFAFIFTCYEYFIHQPMNCVDTATCIQFTYDTYLGLYKNEVDEGDFGNLQFRNITDFFFTFFTIMINFSLIIGVFLYEKKAKDTKNSDWEFKVKQKCYICDNQRNIVDRTRNDNKGFYQHIQEQHNLWSYIFYLIYLKNKQLQRLNVIQNMVMNQWKNHKIDWLPKTYRTS